MFWNFVCNFSTTVFLYLAVRIIETAIIGTILVPYRGKVENFALTSAYVCDYLSVPTVFDPCILIIAVPGARRICVFVQDQLYLTTKTRG